MTCRQLPVAPGSVLVSPRLDRYRISLLLRTKLPHRTGVGPHNAPVVQVVGFIVIRESTVSPVYIPLLRHPLFRSRKYSPSRSFVIDVSDDLLTPVTGIKTIRGRCILLLYVTRDGNSLNVFSLVPFINICFIPYNLRYL